MSVEPIERIAQLEAKADAQEKAMEEVKAILKTTADDLRTLSGITKEHAIHISLLIRALYGTVGAILLSVLGVLMHVVFKYGAELYRVVVK